MTSELHTGPLHKADPNDEHHVGPLQATTRPQKVKRSEQEKRWERRRKRRLFEEVLGWIVVPVILISGFWAVKAGLAAFGTTPTALMEGVKTAISSRS